MYVSMVNIEIQYVNLCTTFGGVDGQYKFLIFGYFFNWSFIFANLSPYIVMYTHAVTNTQQY